MTPKYYPYDAFCMECNEAIYNPICPHCLSEEIISWLETKNNEKLKKNAEKEIKKIIDIGKNYESVKCITCNHDSAFLCPYCFTEIVYEKLKEIGVQKTIIKEFLETFNFDFKHTGYSKELYER